MNKLGDDLYQRLHGFKSVKRSHKKQGQSDWYYLNPRYDTDDDPRGEIDVPSENSFNPKLSSILKDEMNENPEDYYIWRTEKDDRVRGKHAEREGKIFNWHIPPEGGHPGEDYNCRCWAEPYRPERYKDKPMIVDVSGLDMFKELQKTLKPIDFDTSNLPQYAENDKVTTASDAEYIPTKIENPSEKFLSQDFFNLLGFKESSSDYTKHYDDKHSVGAIGMYQFRRPALQEIGYIDKKGKWTGKDGIFSADDLRYNQQIQEKAVREFADRNYKYMQSYKVLPFLRQMIAGKVTNFPITISGMLAASHKEGGPMTAKYLKSLEKNNEGLYYLPYEKYSGDILRSFLAIETRLREFAEVDHN